MTTRLTALFVLLVGAAAVQAGGEDCFNSSHEWKSTATQPENLRVTDADIQALRESIARHEEAREAAALAEREAAEAAARSSAAAAPSKEGG